MINWRELTPHVLNQFPAMQDWEFEELKQSIAEGFDDRMPIIIYKGEDDSRAGIVDGANRHRACLETSTIPSIKEFYGTYEEAMSFILRTNVRRNLNAGQKAAVVLDMDSVVTRLVEEAAKNKNQYAFPTSGKSTHTDKSLGMMAGVGKMTIHQTQKVKQHDPQLYEYVKSGQISAKSAYTQIQDRISDGDAKLSQQRSAKSLLKFAIQEAIDEAKDELYQAALDIVTNSESNKVDFKLKLTII